MDDINKEMVCSIKDEPLDHEEQQHEEVEYKFLTCESVSNKDDIAIHDENTFKAGIKLEHNIFEDDIKKEIDCLSNQEDEQHTINIEKYEQKEKLPTFETCFIKHEATEENNSSENSLNQDNSQQETKFDAYQCEETLSSQDQTNKNHLVIETLKFNMQRRLRLVLHRSGEMKFECKYCYRKFMSKISLENHLLVHEFEKKLECEECHKKFKLKGDFMRHLLTHTGEKPFQCEHCHKKFTTKQNVRIHLLGHKFEKPFKCEQCNKNFTCESVLKKHMLIHGEKKFKCQACDKKFLVKRDLDRHTLIHTGEKPFECKDCHKKFRLKGTLKDHLRVCFSSRPLNFRHRRKCTVQSRKK